MNVDQTLPIRALSANAARTELPTLESARLFAVGREVRIRHCGEEYRLRLTSNNKLILTK